MKAMSRVLCLLLLAPLGATADDGVFRGEGGAVVPSQAAHVRMVAEEVILDLTDPEVVHGTCIFVVTNEGPADSLLIGFPDKAPFDEAASPAVPSPAAIYDLTVMVDGEQVETQPELIGDLRGAGFSQPVLGIAYNRAHVWRCVFDSGQTRVLRTEYRHKSSTYVVARYMVNYILTTGASWAGPIGKVVVRLQPGNLRMKLEHHPRNWTWTGLEYLWTAADVEPAEDIAVGLEDPRAWAQQLIASWRCHSDREPGGGTVMAWEILHDNSIDECEPDFLREVAVAMGDSLPELRAAVESACAEQSKRQH